MTEASPEQAAEDSESLLLQSIHDGMQRLAEDLLQRPKSNSLMESKEFPEVGRLNWFRIDDDEIQLVATQHLAEDDERRINTPINRDWAEVSCTFKRRKEGLELSLQREHPFTISIPNEENHKAPKVHQVVVENGEFAEADGSGTALKEADLQESQDFVERLNSQYQV
jgi:hypothetical protein